MKKKDKLFTLDGNNFFFLRGNQKQILAEPLIKIKKIILLLIKIPLNILEHAHPSIFIYYYSLSIPDG